MKRTIFLGILLYGLGSGPVNGQLPPSDPGDAIRAGLKSEVPVAASIQDAKLISPSQVRQLIGRRTKGQITRLELEIKNGYLFYEVEAGGQEFWIDPGSNKILQTFKSSR